MLTGQISGKYSVEENGLFDLRQRLIRMGINILFPQSDKIIGTWKNIPVTFEITSESSFYEVERRFFNSIRKSSFHILHNKFKNIHGYTGQSAAIETAYALVIGKPVFFLYPLEFGSTVNEEVQHFLTRHLNKMIQLDVSLSENEIFEKLREGYELNKKHVFDITEELLIYRQVDFIFEQYKAK